MVTPQAAPNTAAIYARLSRDKRFGEEREGEGIETQIALCTELASRLGLTVVATFHDNDIGASDKSRNKKPRKGYEKLHAEARADRFAYILATENSRLTRRPLELEGLIQLHQDTGVVIKTVRSGDDDLSKEQGKMVARIKASVDAAEAGLNSERSVAAHRQLALAGKNKRPPWRPFGFLDDAVTHHPKEAQLIREAVDKVIAGASIRQIGKTWEEKGVTSTRGTTYWGHSKVKDALFSWRVAGVRSYHREPLYDEHGEIVMGEWEPIISLEKRTQALQELENHYAKPKRRHGKWLLSGLLRCGKCGRPLYGNQGSGTRPSNYVCSNGRSAHLGIRADKLEKHLELVVHRYILDRAIHGELEPEQQERAPWTGEKQLVSIDSKIEELMEAYNSDRLSSSIVFPQVEKLDQQRRELVSERNRYNADTAPKPRVIVTREQAWRTYRRSRELPFDERRLILKQEIQSVVIMPGKPGSRKHSDFEARVKIHWEEPHPLYNGLTAEEAAYTLLTQINVPGHQLGATEEEQKQYNVDADWYPIERA
ncbi:recombinase family protein [Microbacterium sp. KR10-403]|uniref:recombinase family protein n=1 Tax=Microbacterium sp. KR10-403 TaxID=3158581 RepID=UPI0032E39291